MKDTETDKKPGIPKRTKAKKKNPNKNIPTQQQKKLTILTN